MTIRYIIASVAGVVLLIGMPLFILWVHGKMEFLSRSKNSERTEFHFKSKYPGGFEEVSNSAPYAKGICLGGFLNQKTKGELRRRGHET